MVETFRPNDLLEALTIRKREENVSIYSGGTDLMVAKKNIEKIIFINHLEELKEIEETQDGIEIGAGCTYGEILKSKLIPDILKAPIREIASPAIRNIGTIGGNICNASPAGDTLPVLYALSAVIIIVSLDSKNEVVRRAEPIDEFILGVRRLDLNKNEIVEKIIIDRKKYRNKNHIYYKKVGARQAEAISKVSFVGMMKVKDDVIEELNIAFGSVGTTVIRVKNIEDKIIGKCLDHDKEEISTVLKEYGDYVKTIDDQRSTANYRSKVCKNLLKDFFESASEKLLQESSFLI